MKKLTVVCFVLMGVIKMYAQDTLIFRDGKQLTEKILAVNKSTVQYKRGTYLDGPTFTLSKRKLFEIRLQDGTIMELFEPKFRYKLYNPYFYFQSGKIDISSFGLSHGLSWGLKIRRSKLMLTAYVNSFNKQEMALAFKYGIEF